jgi:exopolysaccharide biosynthesis polyprenyl glycosylphosphotransferase
MRNRDTFDVMCSVGGIVADALAVFGGFMLATWIRFDSGWIPMLHAEPSRRLYIYGAGVATLLFLFIYRSVGLYERPQAGAMVDRVPRVTRATLWGILLATALAFVIRTEPPFSRLTVAIASFTVLVLVLVEKTILFYTELHLARQKGKAQRVLVVGADEVAVHIRRALENEPRLQSEVVAFIAPGEQEIDEHIPGELIKGDLDDFERIVQEERVSKVIMAEAALSHARMVSIILYCEREVIDFALIPDLFRVLTSDVNIQTVDGIPLLGIGEWPLDMFWNRVWKRAEDIVGSAVGLILSAPVIAVASVLIKCESRGPVFFRQERCGESGKQFYLYKLRTMKEDAEAETGPVWTTPDDPRRTKIGAFLRQWNLDELPQFWNVLRGDMSLVGPRPERPHFVEQFKEDISRYMWRHVSKPGITGWAQINGLRGNTSISERIKYDLYYLENWSLAFDFKILIKTFFSRKNAY